MIQTSSSGLAKERGVGRSGSARLKAKGGASQPARSGPLGQGNGAPRVLSGHLKEALDTSVQRQPMATLADAAFVGFVFGAHWMW